MNINMKNKNILFLIALFFLLSNCAQPPIPANIQPTSIAIPASTNIQPTPIILPTLTPPPTHIEQLLPSSTAFVIATITESLTVKSNILGGLSTPPYLVYVKKINDKEQVALVNQDGSGIKTIPLPDNGFHAGNLSPTGEWIVFYTGSEGLQTLTDGPKYDLALNLMHLPDGATHKVTDLLSKDFPDSLSKFADIAKNSNESIISIMDTATSASLVQDSFINSLRMNQWSSSGEVLAFASEIDGPSTDLYLYNLKTGSIRRLSSGSKNIDFIEWFPDGNQILYSSSYTVCEGDCSTYYVTNLDGTSSRMINNFDTFGGGTYIDGWSNNSMMTIYTRANVIGICCLRNFDFENDNLNMLYSGSFENYAYDPQADLLAISIKDNIANLLGIPSTDNTVNISHGVYFIDKNGMRKVEELGLVYYLGWKDYPFVLSANGTKLLSASGKSKLLTEQEFVPFASRNNQYVALCDLGWSQTANGLKVFDNKENLVLEVNNQKIAKVIWRIDSQGLFYVTNNQLYYIGIKEKTPILIDSHLNDKVFDTENNLSFSWVR
ncbi:MAG: hypothetical protein ABI904_11555 [Chloroflexota bacterium]